MSTREHVVRSSATHGGWAVLAVGLAIPLQKLLHAMLPMDLPFLPFALAVLAGCRWGGGAGGLIATAGSALVLFQWFLPPAGSFFDERGLGLSLFVAAGLCVTYQATLPFSGANAILPHSPRKARRMERRIHEQSQIIAQAQPGEAVGLLGSGQSL